MKRIKKSIGKWFGLGEKRQVRFSFDSSSKLVSIIIPFKDKPELLSGAVHSILDKSTHQNFEIIGISNNSEKEETFRQMQQLGDLDNRVRFFEDNRPFNFSQINNEAVRRHAKGDYIVFMNNDIEIISPQWIEALLAEASRKQVGAVGAKLYYADDTVQHAGVTLNANRAPVHVCHRVHRTSKSSRLNTVSSCLAVTGALMMISRKQFDDIGGFDEKLAVAYNDVDLCLRLLDRGYTNIFTPFCEAYHYESLSRGYEDTPQKQRRLAKEKAILRAKHRRILEEPDPFYDTNSL